VPIFAAAASAAAAELEALCADAAALLAAASALFAAASIRAAKSGGTGFFGQPVTLTMSPKPSTPTATRMIDRFIPRSFLPGDLP
jgi:hypothetical protein